MKKITLIVMFLMMTSIFSTQAQAWGSSWNPCANSCVTIEEAREELGLNPDGSQKQENQGSSAKQDAEIQANIEKLVKDFKDSGMKDIDELNPSVAEFLGLNGKSHAERNAELCFEQTWYGQKEITCK